jgi:DNA repair protein RecO (recombination protein O)
MKARQTTAVVIKVFDYGESDKIINFYSPKLSKFTGIAKGAKRSKKRFMNKLELFSELELVYEPSRNSSLVRVDQAELLSPFPGLREDYKKYIAATLFCELLLHWTRENDSEPELYKLLLWSLECLEKGSLPEDIIVFFQVRMFMTLGYQPDLTGCTVCNNENTSLDWHFNLNRCGVICSDCVRINKGNNFSISRGTIEIMKKIQEVELQQLLRLRFSSLSRGQAINIFKNYGNFLLQKEINTWDFVKH